ncbi:hypothetical protein SAMN02910353_01615 [Ruminococcus sp. YRD2003]|uniref:hypothetical protein n=1 Tax=Ruminococcus sp. YRD2003 TaxID=1452313 RepID=UPI0008D63857|nr:hypothetical protein SAMN02910353_01615 [Ruminococcus flavefaciens]
MLKDYANKNMGNTEKDILNCKNVIDERVKKLELSPNNTAPLYKFINDNLSKYDVGFRTILGITYNSRDYAAANRRIIEQNQGILYRKPQDYIFRRDYIENIERIKRIPIHEKLIEQFVGMHTKMLADFDKKCENAKLYDDKLRGNTSMKGFMQSLISNEAALKQDWIEVTRNGQYSIYDIMGIKG